VIGIVESDSELSENEQHTQRGTRTAGLHIGQRVGVAWIASACGHCQYCLSGQENLCPEFRATGRDIDGGYAGFMKVRADFVHPIPDSISDSEAAPLLCAGAVGYRALKLCNLKDGQTLGLMGFGGSNHLATELFNSAAGIKVAHVPYKGPPQALADLAGGQVQLAFVSITSGLPLARAGKVRVLGVTSLTRSRAAPDTPTIAETLPGFELIGWYGVVAPKRTPVAITERLSKAIASSSLLASAGRSIAARIAMIAITTNSSIRGKLMELSRANLGKGLLK
jgi:hypothetical protein